MAISHAQQKGFLGRTTGRLPYLEYGLGDDRLGGAKMTYLDTNILVNIVDSVNEDYKIQLSSGHIGYLPKQNCKQDTTSKQQPYYLTSSWRVWGDDTWDYVSVSLPERLPYRSMQQVAPSKIMVDVFGATLFRLPLFFNQVLIMVSDSPPLLPGAQRE